MAPASKNAAVAEEDIRGRDMSWNRYLIITISFLTGIADSIWVGSVLASFCYILSNDSNTVVGLIEAANGLTTLIVALPVGYIADKGRKSKIIAFGGACIFVAVALTSFVVWETSSSEYVNRTTPHGFTEDYDYDKHHHSDISGVPKWGIWVMGVAMCVWGVASSVCVGPVQALLADSIPKGERSRWYTYTFTCYIGGSIAGPLIALIIFKKFGDHWTLQELRNVFLAGMAMELVCAPLLFLVRDIDTTKEEKKSDSVKLVEKTTCCGLLSASSIPYILFASTLVMALGSGMTIKFFPLFFQNTLKMDPSDVQIIYVAVPVSISIFSGIGTYVASFIGRALGMIVFNLLGVSCLLTMVLLEDKVSVIALVTIYVVRTGLMNSTYPLNESILMDTVPENTRARWKSLEGIAQFGWCGSAVLGGFISDSNGYGRTFLITVCIQTFATFMLIPLIFLVPKEKKDTSQADDDEERQPLISSEDSGLQ